MSLPQIGAASADALNSVPAAASGASKALAFDRPAQLAAWMQGQVQPFNPPAVPARLRAGWKALFRSPGDSDLWRDEDAQPARRREAEAAIGLFWLPDRLGAGRPERAACAEAEPGIYRGSAGSHQNRHCRR